MAYVNDFRTWLGAAALVGSSIFGSAAMAQDSSNLLVQATVGGTCAIGTPGAESNDVTLDFGSFDGDDTDGTALIDFNCTAATNIRLGLGGGLNPSGTDRLMTGSNGGGLIYSLYQDANHTVLWGDDVNTSVNVTGATEGDVTVFGLIPAQDVPAAGNFTDSVLITLTTN